MFLCGVVVFAIFLGGVGGRGELGYPTCLVFVIKLGYLSSILSQYSYQLHECYQNSESRLNHSVQKFTEALRKLRESRRSFL